MWTPSFDVDILPLVGAPAPDQEEDEADGDEGDHDTEPDLVGEWVHKGKYARFLLVWLFDHDTDSSLHEGFCEVYDTLSLFCDRQGGYRHVCSLQFNLF